MTSKIGAGTSRLVAINYGQSEVDSIIKSYTYRLVFEENSSYVSHYHMPFPTIHTMASVKRDVYFLDLPPGLIL